MTKRTQERTMQLPEGCTAAFTFERFGRAETRVARDLLQTQAFDRPTAGREAFDSCTLYPLGHFVGQALSRWGGRTTCHILDGEAEPVAIGVADCSLKDEFDADLGAMIALGRAVKKL